MVFGVLKDIPRNERFADNAKRNRSFGRRRTKVIVRGDAGKLQSLERDQCI